MCAPTRTGILVYTHICVYTDEFFYCNMCTCICTISLRWASRILPTTTTTPTPTKTATMHHSINTQRKRHTTLLQPQPRPLKHAPNFPRRYQLIHQDQTLLIGVNTRPILHTTLLHQCIQSHTVQTLDRRKARTLERRERHAVLHQPLQHHLLEVVPCSPVRSPHLRHVTGRVPVSLLPFLSNLSLLAFLHYPLLFQVKVVVRDRVHVGTRCQQIVQHSFVLFLGA